MPFLLSFILMFHTIVKLEFKFTLHFVCIKLAYVYAKFVLCMFQIQGVGFFCKSLNFAPNQSTFPAINREDLISTTLTETISL